MGAIHIPTTISLLSANSNKSCAKIAEQIKQGLGFAEITPPNSYVITHLCLLIFNLDTLLILSVTINIQLT